MTHILMLVFTVFVSGSTLTACGDEEDMYPMPPEPDYPAEAQCNDGINNDSDEDTDCDDSDCSSDSYCVALKQCTEKFNPVYEWLQGRQWECYVGTATEPVTGEFLAPILEQGNCVFPFPARQYFCLAEKLDVNPYGETADCIDFSGVPARCS